MKSILLFMLIVADILSAGDVGALVSQEQLQQMVPPQRLTVGQVVAVSFNPYKYIETEITRQATRNQSLVFERRIKDDPYVFGRVVGKFSNAILLISTISYTDIDDLPTYESIADTYEQGSDFYCIELDKKNAVYKYYIASETRIFPPQLLLK